MRGRGGSEEGGITGPAVLVICGLDKRVPGSQTGAQRNCLLRAGVVISATGEGGQCQEVDKALFRNEFLKNYDPDMAP